MQDTKIAKLKPNNSGEALATTYTPAKKPAPPKQVVHSASQNGSGNVESIVRAAARKYGINEEHFVSIARCESTFNPQSVNYHYWEDENGTPLGKAGARYYPSGTFQHLTNYWPARAAKYGYAGASVFNATANANVTAGMFRDGASNLWECK